MRSDKWDKDENKPFDGFQKRDDKDHDHSFDSTPNVQDRKCVVCGKTREELRSEW